MRTFLISIALLVTAYYAQAQTCKIKIYYDANGNRIQRILECTAGKPTPDESVFKTETKQTNAFNSFTSGTYQVYPNPAENKVNIKLDADLLAKGCSISLTDITGKVLYQQRAVVDAVSAIDLQGYADGAYFIIIATNNDRHTVKIVKQTGGGY
jgi:hypothetical protein